MSSNIKHDCPFSTIVNNSRITADSGNDWFLTWDFQNLGQYATIPITFCPFCGADLSEKRLETLDRILMDTIHEMCREMGEPCPEGILFATFQSRGMSLADFDTMVEKCIATGEIKRGIQPHTLESSQPWLLPEA